MSSKQRTLLLTAALIGGIGFTARVADNPMPAATTSAVVTRPALAIAKLRDTIHLRGHTISASQEAELLDIAADTYPDRAINADFEPLGLVPPYWEAAAMQALYTLAAADSGTAKLSADRVTFNVVATNVVAWQSRLSALRASLPEGVDVHDQTISVARADIDTLCSDAFARFAPGSIYFKESTTEFRPSAYPRLEQVVALADACRAARIVVTGHSDSSGTETWNQSLSLRRAEAVTEYFASKGVAKDRIRAEGAGSAQPIASNKTRYGRSLNRRIEIEFLPD
ncbi:MAG: OmpA family protein [Pseudomonadota bacterium]